MTSFAAAAADDVVAETDFLTSNPHSPEDGAEDGGSGWNVSRITNEFVGEGDSLDSLQHATSQSYNSCNFSQMFVDNVLSAAVIAIGS